MNAKAIDLPKAVYPEEARKTRAAGTVQVQVLVDETGKVISATAVFGPEELRAAVESSGFAIEQWNDLTDQASALMRTILTLPSSPLGLHAFVPDFAQKAYNLTAALADGRLRAVQSLARAIG